MTATLAAWLEQQVAADEALATAATAGPWAADVREDGRAWIDVAGFDDHAFSLHGWGTTAAHIAAQDPAQTLRRVAAIRQVLALHGPHDHATLPWVCASCAEGYEGHGTGTDWHERVPYPCPTLRALASMFADRDGYRAEEWA